jgi:hypothetical protein
MIFLIKYRDFHWDNYQGGSGSSVEGQIVVELDDHKTNNIPLKRLLEISAHEVILERRPFKQDDVTNYTINSMEILK